MKPPALASVLFDEAHSEAWTIRPGLAASMQPAHPGDCSYAAAAQALRDRGYAVEAVEEGLLDPARLAGHQVLVLAHPSDSHWERTTGIGAPRLTAEEVEAVVAFVEAGGGLIVLGETEHEKYGNNLNELLDRFHLHLENDTVQDYEHNLGAPSWILPELMEGSRGREGDVLARVREVCLYRATTLTVTAGGRVLARARSTSSAPGAPLVALGRHGQGRVALLADSDLFGDDCLDALDHRELWVNLVAWAAAPSPGEPAVARARERLADAPAWGEMREATDALAELQARDGSLAGDAGRAAGLAAEIVRALRELTGRFPHQAAYLQAAIADLRSWVDGGFAQPDFARSLELFRPDRERRDGAEHLVFFPMYKQNGSRETCFEALVVRVPWPEWIAELERTRFENPKFVPVELLDGTRGYRSECAVLFPETVSVGGARPANHFGAIFCDREAERLRRVAGAAVDLLGVNLPPDAARMLASPLICQQAYILWDLVHDRAHSHGELPFDPFMIRQRAPYWMYSLEELRCDLTAFVQAGELVAEGQAFARHVQYAILLDRLLRFPITGSRVRNYDGLGGQLLFAHLHRQGIVRWNDNRLTVDWRRVGEGVATLRGEVEELYRRGIERTKLQHWMAAHDLVAASVPPAAGSRWNRGVRDFDEREDPRPYIDLVLPDEFPLSIFYTSLRAKLSEEPRPQAALAA